MKYSSTSSLCEYDQWVTSWKGYNGSGLKWDYVVIEQKKKISLCKLSFLSKSKILQTFWGLLWPKMTFTAVFEKNWDNYCEMLSIPDFIQLDILNAACNPR